MDWVEIKPNGIKKNVGDPIKKIIHRIFYSLFQKGGMIADRTNSLVRVVGPDKDRFMGEVVCVTSAPREASSLFQLL